MDPECPRDRANGDPQVSSLENLPDGVVEVEGLGAAEAYVTEPSGYVALVSALKDSGYEMCVDLCGVDYLEHPGREVPDALRATRFEVVVTLLSLSRRQRARVRVLAGDDEPRVDSLFSLYPGVEGFERETYDLFGVVFDGHPELTRILLPEEWEGHPLRKDYGLGRVPVQFKETAPQ